MILDAVKVIQIHHAKQLDGFFFFQQSCRVFSMFYPSLNIEGQYLPEEYFICTSLTPLELPICQEITFLCRHQVNTSCFFL